MRETAPTAPTAEINAHDREIARELYVAVRDGSGKSAIALAARRIAETREAAFAAGLEERADEAHATGYAEGLADGIDKGREAGYREGFDEARRSAGFLNGEHGA